MRGVPPSRIELNRQRGAFGNAWEGYQRTFIRTGSFMPIFHALGGLTMLQCMVWAVNGMPDEVRTTTMRTFQFRPFSGLNRAAHAATGARAV